MAGESTFVWDESFYAARDFSPATTSASNAYVTSYGLQYFIVASTALSGNQKLCDIATGSTNTGATRPIGIAQNTASSGHAITVRMLGRSKCVAASSGSIAYGDYISSSTQGTAITIATSGAAVLGIARSASTSAAGQIIEVDLFGPWGYVIGG